MPIIATGAAIAIPLLQVALMATPQTSAATIRWAPCPASLHQQVGDIPGISERMECANLQVPLDHREPENDKRTYNLAIMRIAAAFPEQRVGSLFFNPGGPGGSPFDFMPPMAELWMQPDWNHLGELAGKFDLVGIQPRGLPGLNGEPGVLCRSSEIAPAHLSVADHRDDANYQRAVQATEAHARACQQQPDMAYINTEQTVHDMEAVRVALGEEKLNYLGTSYGTWLGAWYAAMYPSQVGRMVLDSNMIWTSTIDANKINSQEEAQYQFQVLIAKKAAAAPDRYHLGDYYDALRSLFVMNPHVRGAIRPDLLKGPEALMAGRFLEAQLRENPALDAAAMTQRLEAHTFSADANVQETARHFGAAAIERLYAPSPVDRPVALSAMDSVYTLITCNDLPSNRDTNDWRKRGDYYAMVFPAGDASSTLTECPYWIQPSANAPSQWSMLDNSTNILLIQAEYDLATPRANLDRIRESVRGLEMVVARGLQTHGVVFSNNACMNQRVVQFFLGVPRNRGADEAPITYCEEEREARSLSQDTLDAASRLQSRLLQTNLRHP